MRRPTIVGAGLAALLAGGITTGLGAYTTYARWAGGSATFFVNPVNQDVSQSAAATAIQTAMDVWNTQSGSPFRIYYGGPTTSTSLVNDGRNVVFFRNASNGSTIASTYSWWDGNNNLIDSDIVFWDSTFTFFTGTSGCGVVSNAAYIEDIATHELGHAIGLNHSTATDATMYPNYSYCSQAFRTLAADDINGVKTLYPADTPNTAPTVTILSPLNGSTAAEGTTVTFSGSATDTQDGTLTSSMEWRDNGAVIGTGGSFSRSLTAGTHSIEARVTDRGGLQSSRTVSITVAAQTLTNTTGTLSARGRVKKGYQFADLTWGGVTGTSVDVYRNGVRVTSTTNDGGHTDALNKKGSATYTYKVCAAGTTTCTNSATVSF